MLIVELITVFIVSQFRFLFFFVANLKLYLMCPLLCVCFITISVMEFNMYFLLLLYKSYELTLENLITSWGPFVMLPMCYFLVHLYIYYNKKNITKQNYYSNNYYTYFCCCCCYVLSIATTITYNASLFFLCSLNKKENVIYGLVVLFMIEKLFYYFYLSKGVVQKWWDNKKKFMFMLLMYDITYKCLLHQQWASCNN